MKGLVSIIIPSYNYGHLIKETLTSIVEQTYPNWECIIIDDGSTDHTSQVVNQFINQHPGYQIIYLEVPNGGTSAAKNKGINLAQGEFIQFLDADDLLSKEKLAVQMRVAEKNSAGLIFSKSIYFTGSPAQPNVVQKYPVGFLANESLYGAELLRRMITNNILTISSPLMKRELVMQAGCFDPSLKNNEDWLFWFKIATLNPVFVFDGAEESFTLIRIHPNSAVNNKKKMFEGEVVVRAYIDRAIGDFKPEQDKFILKQLNLNLLALHQVRSLDVYKGFSYILLSFVKNPIEVFPLLKKGFFRLGTRIYKTLGK